MNARSWGVWAVAALCGLTLTACASGSRARGYDPTRVRFYLEAAAGEAGTEVVLPQSGTRIAVQQKPVLMESDVVNAELVQVELGQCLLFEFSPAAARDLYRLTGAHQGRRLVVAINQAAVGARLIDRPFAEGSMLVFVEVPDEALPDLVSNLKNTAVELQKEMARRP